jgi:hypothetical protein
VTTVAVATAIHRDRLAATPLVLRDIEELISSVLRGTVVPAANSWAGPSGDRVRRL